MVRRGLIAVLSREPDFQVVGEARDGVEALESVSRMRPDIILLDGVLPDMHVVEVLRRILETWPEARVIMLSINDTAEDVHRAMDSGAWGYMTKSSEEAEMLQSIRSVASGKQFLSLELSRKLAQRNVLSSLSSRELLVLGCIARGKENKEIAQELGIGGASVKTYITRIFVKLGAHDRTQAVSIARDRGILR